MIYAKLTLEVFKSLLGNETSFWTVAHGRAIHITIDSYSEMGVAFRVNLHNKRKYVSLDTFFKSYWKARVTPHMVEILLELVGTRQPEHGFGTTAALTAALDKNSIKL